MVAPLPVYQFIKAISVPLTVYVLVSPVMAAVGPLRVYWAFNELDAIKPKTRHNINLKGLIVSIFIFEYNILLVFG